MFARLYSDAHGLSTTFPSSSESPSTPLDADQETGHSDATDNARPGTGRAYPFVSAVRHPVQTF